MPILDKLRSMVGRGERRSFTYECRECEHVFESETPSRSKATCPECGSGRIMAAPTKTPTA